MRMTWRTPLNSDPYTGNTAGSVRSNKILWTSRPGALSAVWTDTTNGALTVWGCNREDEEDAADISSAFSVVTQPAGVPDSATLNAPTIAFAYVWFEFARVSGSGGIQGDFSLPV